jgi:hypothetical protein
MDLSAIEWNLIGVQAQLNKRLWAYPGDAFRFLVDVFAHKFIFPQMHANMRE